MSEEKFTPGPWAMWSEEGKFPSGVYKYSVCNESPPGRHGDGHQCIATALGFSVDESRANAHLIAAAPDLYEALEALVEATRQPPIGPAWSLAHREARAALARARGETP